KDADDGNGHGTHVAGTVGALDNGRDVVGVAPGASLWAVRVLTDDGAGSWTDIIEGIDWVTKNASTIEVANMSLGGTGQLSSARTAIQNSVDAGVVYTVAAGNSIPAIYPEVATISALRDTDGTPSDDEFASFSNYAGSVTSSNPVSSPGAAIDLMLPGVYILSTKMGGGTTRKSGTSMASPHAAGLAALRLAEKGTRDLNGDGTVDADDVYQLRQTLIDEGVAQDSADGLATLNDPDSNWERLGWAESSNSTASWLQPGDGTTVSGSTEVQIDASDSEDDTGTLQVEWRVDGGSWRSTSYDSSNAVYSASWDTTQLADGTHTLEGRAVDSAGNVTRTASVGVTVDNSTDTDTAPDATWLQPSDGSTVSGSTGVQIDASDTEDDAGTLQVDWRVDGGTWRSTTYDSSNAVYSASWDTTQLADGTHTLEGRAVDSAGNVTRTASVSVTVDNTQDDGGSTTDTYVWNIDFSQRDRGKGGAKHDLRTYVTTHLDSDGDGTAESSDSALKEATVEVTLTRDTDGHGTFECGGDDTCSRHTGTTNGKGEMKFTAKDVATGRYQAEVTALTSTTGSWDPAVDADNPDTFLVD
ncbi:MAG: S8 family serine peptidase, partial [Bradymonadaceae bacterium]